MKRLLLLRHCEAAPAQGAHDKDRHLSAHGHAQAEALGQAMQKHSFVPHKILCSAATRTRHTYEGVAKSFETLDVDFKDEIYTASTGDLVALVQNASDEIQQLMIIGHNPCIYELAVRLCGEERPEKISKLGMGYAPGSLSVIDIRAENWADIQFAENILFDLIAPNDYFQS